MNYQLLFCLVCIPLACGKVAENDQPAPANEGTSAPSSAVSEVTAEPQFVPPEETVSGLIQASYRTTSIQLEDGSQLDTGHAVLVIDTSRTPVSAVLHVTAGGAGRAIAARLELETSDLLVRGEARLAATHSSYLRVRELNHQEHELQLNEVALKRIGVKGRRSQLLLRALAANGSPVATLTTQYEITCLTTPNLLGEQPNGRIGDDSAPAIMLVPDTALRSDACKPFRSLL